MEHIIQVILLFLEHSVRGINEGIKDGLAIFLWTKTIFHLIIVNCRRQ